MLTFFFFFSSDSRRPRLKVTYNCITGGRPTKNCIFTVSFGANQRWRKGGSSVAKSDGDFRVKHFVYGHTCGFNHGIISYFGLNGQRYAECFCFGEFAFLMKLGLLSLPFFLGLVRFFISLIDSIFV